MKGRLSLIALIAFIAAPTMVVAWYSGQAFLFSHLAAGWYFGAWPPDLGYAIIRTLIPTCMFGVAPSMALGAIALGIKSMGR